MSTDWEKVKMDYPDLAAAVSEMRKVFGNPDWVIVEDNDGVEIFEWHLKSQD